MMRVSKASLPSNESYIAKKTITFDGTAGNGAVGSVNCFSVTGMVIAEFYARCTSDLTGATATVALGVASNTTLFIASTTATGIDNSFVWIDSTPAKTRSKAATTPKLIETDTVLITVGTANVTGGTVEVYALWRPISASATLTAL